MTVLHYLMSELMKLLNALPPSSISQIILFSLGVAGFVDGRRQRHKMQEIAEGTSTRFIGLFPKHLNYLVDLINSAHHEISILVDCVDYGSFFSPEIHKRVVEAIENARSPARKVVVRI